MRRTKDVMLTTSIIIPTYDKYPRLKFTLRYLLANPLPKGCEIVLVHQGADESKSLLRSYQHSSIRYIHLEQPVGRSAARNLGVKHAQGKLLIFLDDDILVKHDFVANHQRLHADSDSTVVHGRILTYRDCKFMIDPESGRLDQRFVKSAISKGNRRVREQMTLSFDQDPDEGFDWVAARSREDYIEKQIQSITSVPDRQVGGPFRWLAATTGNLSMSRELFELAGGFHEPFGKLWGLEDLELGFRLSRMNHVRFVYGQDCPGIHIAHARADGTEQFLEALQLFLQKHPNHKRRIGKLKNILVDRDLQVADLSEDFLEHV